MTQPRRLRLGRGPAECPCQLARATDRADLLEVFGGLRSKCPVLRELLVPDEDWPAFERWHLQSDHEASHWSTALLALIRGHLPAYTLALHQFAIRDGGVAPDLQPNYRGSLRERWIQQVDMKARQRGANRFLGFMAEFHVAQWLLEHGWSISNLAALGGLFDIVASDSARRLTSCEVKYLGPDDDDCQMIVASMHDRDYRSQANWYGATNYLLSRLYESAFQLSEAVGDRAAVVVYDDIAWEHIDMPLKWNWIDWDSARFNGQAGSRWSTFLVETLKPKYPTIELDLAERVRSLTRVMLFRERPGYDYTLEYER